MFDHAQPCGGDEQAVAFALVHDLGVARDELHTSGGRGLLHRPDDASERLHRQAFLDDESGAQPLRPRAAHGEVVDCSVDGERADVAAGKKQRMHDVGIGGEGEALAADVNHRAVVTLVEQRVAERGQEQLFDELDS